MSPFFNNPSQQELHANIQRGLDNLLVSLSGDTSRMYRMIDLFIQDTPLQFEIIQASLHQEKRKEAAAVLHKVKSRYGYFDLEDITDDIQRWQEELLQSSGNELAIERLHYFQQLNGVVIQELQRNLGNTEKAGDSSSLMPLRNKCVLIAEDDAVNRMVFTIFIQELGGDVIEANHGQEAISFVMERQPDLVFMDIHMPYINGLDAIRKLREQGVTIPIISLSASTRLNEQHLSLEAGATDFLVKPIRKEIIRQVLLKYLCE